MLPAWYQTAWAWVAYVALGLLAVCAIVRLSQRGLAARNRQLEEVVAERTAEIRQQRDLLDRLAHEDALTGLGNRRLLDQHLAKEVLRAGHFQRSMCLAMLDLDHFKAINDHYGHVLGDQVLRRVADIARSCVRPVDLLARYGGEELIIQFPETELEEALAICEKLRLNIADEDWSALARDLKVTVSIGVTQSRSGDDHQQLLARADEAMYRAKQQGRNRVV